MNLYKFLLPGFALLFATPLFSQQWLDKHYDFEVFSDSVYGYATNFYGSTDTLKMDIYSPICDDVSQTSRRPLLIWIHGGAFLFGDKSDNSIVNLCEEFAKRGYVTASIDYRLGYVSDDNAHACNFPDYECLFAADSAEWVRAYYRSVQDAKGAIRYLVNRNSEFRIDTNNVFIAGESAGAFAALGAALMDDDDERPVQTFASTAVPLPGNYALNCGYNQGVSFPAGAISRPDLGDINGAIEPSTIQYTLKGVGNMFGGMFGDLLAISNADIKPAIYAFHQRCDLVVPIDSGVVFEGVSWCLTNGYNCYAFANNNVTLYGSRAIRDWNDINNYGYNMVSDFSSVEFPYDFWLGEGSCIDQGLNVSCHGYANKALRENNLAALFAPLITTNPVCDTTLVSSLSEVDQVIYELYPNPVVNTLSVKSDYSGLVQVRFINVMGKLVLERNVNFSNFSQFDLGTLPGGIYFMEINADYGRQVFKIVKQEL